MKIIIADDEKPIRDWLNMNIRRAGAGYEVVAACKNGKEAFEQAMAVHPDLLITDIAMPVMGGIELVDSLREAGYELPIAVLTCHNDFEYVRHALKTNVFDYILKSEIDAGLLGSLFQRVGEAYGTAGASRRFQEGSEKLLVFLSNRNHDRDDICRLFDRDDRSYCVFCVKKNQMESQHILKELGRSEEAGSGRVFAAVWEGKLFLVRRLSGGREEEERISFFEQIEKALGKTGKSRICRRPEQLLTATGEAERELCLRFYDDGVKSVEENPTRTEDPRLLISRYTETVYRLCDNDRLDEAAAAFLELCRKLGELRFTDIVYLKFMVTNIMNFFAFRLNDGQGGISEETEACFLQIHMSDSFSDMMEHAVQFFETWGAGGFQKGKKLSPYIAGALHYIDDSYRTISGAEEVAALLHLNTDYFCRIFKKDTGVTFGRYLMEYRLKKALILLQTSGQSVSSVSCSVGFENVNYFSRLFKLHYGVPPSSLLQ